MDEFRTWCYRKWMALRLFLLLFALGGTPVIADQALETIARLDYPTLLGWFDDEEASQRVVFGALFTGKDESRTFVGRCFSDVTYRTKPQAAALTISNHAATYRFFVAFNPEQPESFFDEFTYDRKASLEKIPHIHHTRSVRLPDGDWATELTPKDSHFLTTLRRYQSKYILSKAVALADTGAYLKGETGPACIFFREMFHKTPPAPRSRIDYSQPNFQPRSSGGRLNYVNPARDGAKEKGRVNHYDPPLPRRSSME